MHGLTNVEFRCEFVKQQLPIQVAPSPLPSWWAGVIGVAHLCGVLNVVGLILTAVGTYLTVKGNHAIKKARLVSATARRNVLMQVAASEFVECRGQVQILRVHVGNCNWVVSEHICSFLATKLSEAKTSALGLEGINRDRLEVASRAASQLNALLNSGTDGEKTVEKAQELCDYLSGLLGDIYGSLRLKEPEEII